jgi:presenilin-like A22 family membrane protease
MRREVMSIAAMGCLLVIALMLALVLAGPFQASNLQAFPEPENLVNPLIYILLILGFTALILLIVKYGRQSMIRYLILIVMAMALWFVFFLPFAYLYDFLFPDLSFAVFEAVVNLSSLAAALAITAGLYYHPEWWLVDSSGVAVAAGVTAVIGISFAILPTFLLLIALAVYDAISVYKTKHMIVLADAVAGERLPILLVVPKTLKYSFMKQPGLKKQLAEGTEREAMFMGLGDIIIPGILVVSAFSFLSPEAELGTYANLLVAMITLVGILVGFLILMRYVLKGNPQAGLPLLNSGAMLGYVVGYLLVYRDLSLGMTLSF